MNNLKSHRSGFMTRGRFKNYNSLLYTLVEMLWGTNSLNKTRYHIGWRNPLLNHSFYFLTNVFCLCKTLFIGKTNDWAGVLLYYYNRFGQSSLVTFFLSEGHAWCIYRELRLSMLWGNEKKTSNLTHTVAIFLLMPTFTTLQFFNWS